MSQGAVAGLPVMVAGCRAGQGRAGQGRAGQGMQLNGFKELLLLSAFLLFPLCGQRHGMFAECDCMV